MRFLFDFAWRDLRSSGQSLWVFFACLVLGVTLLSATGGLYRLVNLSLLADTRAIMGGDLEVVTNQPLTGEALNWIKANGVVSMVTEVDTMLGTERDRFLRIELQTMDAQYPLYGGLVLEPSRPLSKITAFTNDQWGVAIDPTLANRLDIKVGDNVTIGALTMKVRALVLKQPDRSLNADWRGTPVLLSAEALQASGLIQPGSRIDYEYRVRTNQSAETWRLNFYDAFPDETWEVRTFNDRSQRLSERLGQVASGLLIIGFSTLFIGGLGVFNSIQAYLQGKLKTIATLRALGLRNRRLAIVYLLQIAILAGAASLLGVLIGSGLTLVGASIVTTQIPLRINFGDLFYPSIIAFFFGLLTAYSFALPALGKALSTDPASLFRGLEQKGMPLPHKWWLATLACATLIVSMILLVLPDTLFGVGFVLVIGALLLILDLVVRGIRRWARLMEDHPWMRGRLALKLALANLHRPDNNLRISLISLGSALTLLVACTLIVVSLLRTLNATIPEQSPGLVLYDVLNDQVDVVVDAIESLPSVKKVDIAPLVRGRINALNGRVLSDVDQLNEIQRRDSSQERYKLSYLSNNIDDVSIVDGAWWSEPVSGLPKLAFEDREANKLGLRVGDVVTFALQGTSFDAEIAAIYSQKGMQTRFWFEGILSKGALDPFITRHVGAVYIDDEQAIAAQNRIAVIAPNVITVRTASLLQVARQILGKAGSGLAVVASVSLLASLLVLISVMAAGRNRQIYEATILHSLGVRMATIKHSLQLEYMLLALISSVFAVLLGSAIALPLLEFRLKLPSTDLVWLGAIVAIVVSTLALGSGAAYLLRRLRLKPAVLLRSSN
ncbi:ABC transporter permease [Neptunomonas antarctica]|uniref:Putative ABC transport system permease protein n=1 Tax=Neptunomonas antarctica TaxID=619304 RepID=A0A1N7JA26_9GAMM|nr:FtsX-like permease family protein [Neptunomonas antarctica]SIS46175.1 putative ABC transport system permease protein [Neptunomonas antarctica]